MLIGLNWITLRVRDLEASLAFYHGVLGLPVHRRFESRGRQIAMLGTENETKLELIENSGTILKPEARKTQKRRNSAEGGSGSGRKINLYS